MKITLVLVFLWSGFFHFTFTSQRLRSFSYVNILDLNWTESLHECNKTNGSLVTLYDEEDANFATSYLQKTDTDEEGFWIGLHTSQSITWSDDAPYTSNVTEDVRKGSQICQAIDYGKWKGFNCSDKKPFMCYNGSAYDLILHNKTWCQARKHCKEHLQSDLVSIRNETQNDTVIEKGNNTSFWIGLMLDEWRWEDKGCSTYRNWIHKEDEDIACAYLWKSRQGLNGVSCGDEKLPFCSNGTVRIKVIKQRHTWEDAFDYCRNHHTRLLWIRDESDQYAVEQWLNHTDAPGPFWIGLRQSRIFGFWIWSSDTTVNWNEWEGGRSPELPLSNHCGVIKKGDYKWSDENCRKEQFFLCEEEIFFM